jgi:predicted ATPase/transcriptional regulator with XRE-family HTH domain
METGTPATPDGADPDGFGQWLKERRRALDLTQRALAQQAGCSPETIKKIEAGRLRPSRQLAGLLLARLQIPPDEQPAFVRWARQGGRPAPAAVAPPLPPPWPRGLPAPATALIGREAEVAAICARLRQPEVRLLTLTGPAGIGKTRLALQVAAALGPDFAGEVAFVPLAAVTDPALVAARIAATLGLREAAGEALPALLLETLAPRRLLLVLDNFEQVLPARRLVADLLAAGPRVQILVTSRAVLHLYGEHLFPVPPLPLPAAGPVPSPADLGQVAAVRLFVERARAVQPTFALTPDNAAVVAEICRRLDGLPLALELAAAQVQRLDPPTLLARLDARLALLTGGPWDQSPRQQTLRGAIAWSDDLLSAAQRGVFYRLGVFHGGFTPDAVAAVAGDAGQQGALEALADQSLVQRIAGGSPRFALLETIRAYALERLASQGGAAAARDRHAAYFLALAERAAPELARPDQGRWLARLDEEHDNLRAALGHFLDRGDRAGAARLGGALGRFWYLRATFSEGRRWLAATLAGSPALPEPVEATALHWAGVLAWSQGDYDEARARLDQSLALRRAGDDHPGVAAVLTSLGAVALTQGDYAGAGALFAESLALNRAADDQPGVALALANLGLVRLDQGQYAEAAALLQESLALRRALGDGQSIAQCLNNLGTVRRCQGAYAAAAALHRESLTLFQALGDTWSEALVLANLGVVRLEEGADAEAARLLRASLALFQARNVKPGIATCLDGLAWVAAEQGQPDLALRLAAESTTLRTAIHSPRTPADEAAHQRHMAAVRRDVPPSEN